MTLRTLLIVLLLPLLAACDIEPAGYSIDGGGDHSLTVERRKPYFWSSGWELDLIVARYPDCQRRYPLKKAGEKTRIDLYRVQPGIFVLNQGNRWYIAETKECRFQQYDEEPPEPGDFVGTFRVKNGMFGFVPDESAAEENGKAKPKAAKK